MGAGAAIAAAGVAAAGSIGGALITSQSARSAANSQSAAAQNAADAAQAQYQQTRTDLAPYRATGGLALNRLSDIMGLTSGTSAPVAGSPSGGSYTSAPQFQSTPDPWLAASSLTGIAGFDSYGSTPLQDGTGNVAVFQRGGPDGNTLIGTAAGGQDLSAFLSARGIQPTGNGNYGTFMPGASGTMPGSGGSSGSGGGNPLAQYGLSGLTFQPTQSQLESTPGYQFDLSQGLKSVQSSNAAKGLGVSGAALKGAAQYATGLANNTLGTQQGIFQANLGNVMNPLMAMASNGQNAANQTGTFGANATNSSNAALIGGANAQASGMVGGANALSGGFNSAVNAYQNYNLMNKLTNPGGYGLPSGSTVTSGDGSTTYNPAALQGLA